MKIIHKRVFSLLCFLIIIGPNFYPGTVTLPKNVLGFPEKWELNDEQLIITIITPRGIIEIQVDQKTMDLGGCLPLDFEVCAGPVFQVVIKDSFIVSCLAKDICKHNFKKVKYPYNYRHLRYRFEFTRKGKSVMVFYATAKGEIELKGDEEHLYIQTDEGENWLLEIMKHITYHFYDDKLLLEPENKR